ncbi:Trimeric GatFAB AmidoTransferase(AdT) complex subunit [Coemansia sp. Benny D115]|nr:Trimeric GatFAB AmidoTransferase(AdT) complex subunit [Coemansia sp. Benny D115]
MKGRTHSSWSFRTQRTIGLHRLHKQYQHQQRYRFSSQSTAQISVQEAVSTISTRNQKINAFVNNNKNNKNTSDIDYVSTPTTELPSGALNGWPVGIKSNVATKTNQTSCASRALENYVSPFESTAVSALVQAGAVILGKTNMDEFGMGSKNQFSIYGAATNPSRPDSHSDSSSAQYSTGGSSGGSAAAVASGMCRIALGSDTGGSVRLPAAWCGVVGFKPTYGRISRYGLVSYGSSLDAIGVLSRTVQDAHAAYSAMAIPDNRDMTCMRSSLRARIDSLAGSRAWIKELNLTAGGGVPEAQPKPLSGIRVGIPKECWVEELSHSALESWRAGARRLADLGCEIMKVTLSHLPHSLPAYYTVALAEASSNLARFDGIRYGRRSEKPPSSAPGLSASHKYAHTRSEGFGDEVQRRILLGTYVMSASACRHYYQPSQQIRRLIQQEFDSVFALPNALEDISGLDSESLPTNHRPAEKVDVLLFPTATDTAPPLEGHEANPAASYVNDVMTVPANLAGLPAISVPFGSEAGMPLGLQLMAQYGDDELLLQIARHLQ